MDYSNQTDDELAALSASVNIERVRRATIAVAPGRLESVFADYAGAGGDPATLAQLAADYAAALAR